MSSLPQSSGIYLITCIANGRKYVGSALNLRNRRKNHHYYFRHQKHQNQHLQRAYNKYGRDSLEFSVLEECPTELLLEREQSWIDTLKPEFNMRLVAGSCRGMKHSPETRARQSAALKGKPGHTQSPETRAKISAKLKGRKLPPEQVAKIVVANTGKKRSDETRARIGVASKGRAVSPETRAKLSAVHKGKPFSPEHCANISAAKRAKRKQLPETPPI